MIDMETLQATEEWEEYGNARFEAGRERRMEELCKLTLPEIMEEIYKWAIANKGVKK